MGFRPDVAEVDGIPVSIVAQGIIEEVSMHVAYQCVSDDQWRGREEIHSYKRMNAPFEVSVSGEHRAADDVAGLNRFRDSHRQGSRVADAGSAAVADDTESELFEVILGRENGPIKPDPWSILSICQQWGVEPRRVVFLGDYLFDMQAGRNAGTQTVLFSRGRPRGSLAGEELADYVLDSFLDLDLVWLAKPVKVV